jgi:DNA-binding response OmpR family regulator
MGVTKGGSVLVVDDELSLREMLERALTLAGIKVDAAEDGDKALAKLEANRYDAVITDIVMPDRDGVELIMKIRDRWPDTFIIAMSGGGRIGADKFLDLAKALGADRTLAKPFKPSQIISLLASGAPPRIAA